MNISDMISPVVKDIKPSGIRKFFDLINEMKDAISLSVGEPDFDTPWNVREAGIYSLEKGHTHYSPNAGYIRLREEISIYLKRRFNLRYSPKTQVLVTVGGSEAIDLAMRCLCGPGDEVIIPEPSFVAYRPCIQLAGATPVTLGLKPENGFKLMPDELQKAITEKTRIVVLPFPNNPTGAIMRKKDLDGIVEVLKDKNIMIVSDEIYSELTYGEKHVSIASYPEMKDRTILINGFSKSYAMTGWRLGYACGHPDIIAAMTKIHQLTIMCAPTTAQHAAIEALSGSDEDVEEMRKEYNYRRRVMLDGFQKAGFPCFEPEGAFYVFAGISHTGMTSEVFCEKLLMEERVAVVPGSAFGDSGEGFVRACYASSLDNINEAMKRIQNFAKKI